VADHHGGGVTTAVVEIAAVAGTTAARRTSSNRSSDMVEDHSSTRSQYVKETFLQIKLQCPLGARNRCNLACEMKRARIESNKQRTSSSEQNPCASTGKPNESCPGYVIDHRRAVAEGGADEPSEYAVANHSRCKSKG
jgi:hypothetical protein